MSGLGRKTTMAATAMILALGAMSAMGQSTPAAYDKPAPVKTADVECTKCEGFLLPGAMEADPHSVYDIHSDLPEVALSTGVLYATTPVLPPFKLHNGTELPEDRRTQVNSGFKTLDNDFQLFLFHITQPGGGQQPRRFTVYVKNNGTEPVTVDSVQAFVTDGIIGTVHQMESNLGRLAMERHGEPICRETVIAPGTGTLVACSKVVGGGSNNMRVSSNVNCFGRVWVDIKNPTPATDLTAFVVAIPAELEFTKSIAAAESLLGTGAQSGETYLDFMTDPTECQLRRTTGVFKSFVWRSKTQTLDSTAFPEGGYSFQMAVPAVQSTACPEIRQTSDLLLHPKYSLPDTVGNYKIEYRSAFRFANPGKTPRRIDVRFGKSDADIGLAWQIATTGDTPATDAAVDALPVRTGWAGPKQVGDLADDTRSFFEYDNGPIVVPAGETKTVTLRYMVLGNSSLPYQLRLTSHDVAETTPEAGN